MQTAAAPEVCDLAPLRDGYSLLSWELDAGTPASNSHECEPSLTVAIELEWILSLTELDFQALFTFYFPGMDNLLTDFLNWLCLDPGCMVPIPGGVLGPVLVGDVGCGHLFCRF